MMHKGGGKKQNLKMRSRNYWKRNGEQKETSVPVCRSVVLSHLDPSSFSIHKGVVDLNSVPRRRIEIMEQFPF